jgi:hypothetical protein
MQDGQGGGYSELPPRSFGAAPERAAVERVDRKEAIALARAALDAMVKLKREDTEQLRERERTRRLVAMLVTPLAAVLAAIGGWLTYLGAGAGQSTISLFGQQLSTTSVGLGCVFVGGVLGAVILRRVLGP